MAKRLRKKNSRLSALTTKPRRANRVDPRPLQKLWRPGPDLEETILEERLARLFGAPHYLQLLVEIVRSPAFKRLRDIRFLGAIDYLIQPSSSAGKKRHTRYEHSLGVARLARDYSQQIGVSEKEQRHLVVAALLHDVGHGPLSHSLEPVFRNTFYLAHHEASALIIGGTVPIGTELPAIFRRHGIDYRHVLDLISGKATEPYAAAFNSPINIDTIEGITRSFGYITSEKSVPNAADILTAVVSAGPRATSLLDGFWAMKNLVYDQVINSKTGVVADYLCREYMESNARRFWSGNFFITERQLRKQHPTLFAALDRLRLEQRKILGGDDIYIDFEKRHFYVDSGVTLSAPEDLHKRYKQGKTRQRIRVGDVRELFKAQARRKHPYLLPEKEIDQ